MNTTMKPLALILLLILLAGCRASPQVETSTVPAATPTVAQAVPQSTQEPVDSPEAGKSIVVGQIVSTSTEAPMANMGVRLAEVHRQGDQGAFLLDTAFGPGDYTDENGYFIFENIAPGEYVLVVGNVEVYEGYEIIPDSSGRAQVYDFPADEVTDIGIVRVNLAPAP
jgi:hypothetical protein